MVQRPIKVTDKLTGQIFLNIVAVQLSGCVKRPWAPEEEEKDDGRGQTVPLKGR